MVDLSLVELNEMLAELEKRYDSVIFAACRSRTDTFNEHLAWWTGGHLTCLGLLSIAQQDILDDHDDWKGDDDGRD